MKKKTRLSANLGIRLYAVTVQWDYSFNESLTAGNKKASTRSADETKTIT